MLKARHLFILVTLSTLVTLVVNGLANALPLNGLTTGAISDRFQVYFVPAGYVFSIWGLIYLGLLAFTVYQALPAQQGNPRLDDIRPWVVVSNLANAAWIFLWHHEQFPMTLLAMGTLRVALVVICPFFGFTALIVLMHMHGLGLSAAYAISSYWRSFSSWLASTSPLATSPA